MEQFIGCDAHKKFSVFVAVNEKGHAGEVLRVAHDRQVYREFLARLPAHSAIAVEASGTYSWLIDEMERLSHRPRLCNPLEAKRRTGLTNKTDKLDARGLAILLRNGTFPEVWSRPGTYPTAYCRPRQSARQVPDSSRDPVLQRDRTRCRKQRQATLGPLALVLSQI